MQTLQFNIDIKAKAQKVYETMLGLIDKSNYEKLTSAFNPTSTYEGSWDKGSKIYLPCQVLSRNTLKKNLVK